MDGGCAHFDQITDAAPSGNGCVECLQTGSRWVHLRMCLTCGHIGCCDQSKGKHATKHAAESSHPIIRSFEPGEEWMWCYPDQTFFEG